MTLSFGLPQLIFSSVILAQWIVAVSRFGETKRRDQYDLIDVLIGPALLIGLLYWGGFYGR